MLADDKWSLCNARKIYGIYIWTAGQWEHPKSSAKFVWKSTDNLKKPGITEYRNQVMGYTNWHNGQPDNQGGTEAYVNLWKKIQLQME